MTQKSQKDIKILFCDSCVSFATSAFKDF